MSLTPKLLKFDLIIIKEFLQLLHNKDSAFCYDYFHVS